MVGPDPGQRQPFKVAGYALLILAGLTAIIGLISLASVRSETDQAAAAPVAGPAAPRLDGDASTNQPAAPPAPAPAAPPSPVTAAPALPAAGLPAEGTTGKGRSAGTAKAPVRVYNNSLVKGLAERAADDIRDSGWKVTDVGNYADGAIPTSTVYYRPGTSEQAAARSLAESFGMRAAPRFAGIKDASPGLIVIVTKDYQHR